MTRLSNVLVVTGVLAIGAIVGALSMTGAARAGDAAEFRSHGFSDDERGRYFAFEEFGVEGGPHYPYSNIYIVDLATDKWVPDTPIRIRLEEEGETPLLARVKAFQEATPIMQQYQISNSGVLMAASPISEMGDKTVVRFQQTAQPLLTTAPTPYELRLETKNVKDLSGCETNNGMVTGFSLTLTTPTGETRSLHDEQSSPQSRGCPLDYHISAVFAPTRVVAETHAVALIGVFSQSDGGQNLRYIAVPFTF
jgi:predicted secreted protein